MSPIRRKSAIVEDKVSRRRSQLKYNAECMSQATKVLPQALNGEPNLRDREVVGRLVLQVFLADIPIRCLFVGMNPPPG